MADPRQLFLGLLLAHLASDFLFQPDGWVRAKEGKGFRSGVLVLHAAVAGGLAALMGAGALHPVWAFAVTASSHWAMDGLKARFGKGGIRWLLADQTLHLAVIGVLVWWNPPGAPIPSGLETLWRATLGSERVRVWGCGLLLVGLPGSIAVRAMMDFWNVGKGFLAQEREEAGGGVINGLENAGKWIGILERLFILIFILSGHWEGIGFLVVAKSILRFGDIKESNGRKMAEYILLGTLVSYLWAVAVGMAAKAMLPSLY